MISKDITLRAIVGIVSSLGVLVGAVIAVESRYVHAADLEQFKQEQVRAFKQQSADSQITVNELRKQMLEDKIFEIQLIPPSRRTDVDRARLDKYSRDLDTVNKRTTDIRSLR
jgi:hypothetical protein